MILPATPDAIQRAAAILREGGVVAFPTETVYGLGANALDATAVRRIYEMKQRPFASPLIVHASDMEMARSVVAEWPAVADLLAKRFWPGPLTMVIRKAAIIPDLVTAGLPSVGVRVPANPVALELIRQAGVPIAAPSANRFTQVSPTTAEHVQSGLGDRVTMILDGGACHVGIESTVVALRSGGPVILRPGMISQSELEQTTQTRWERELNLPRLEDAFESPGQHPRHYAPRTPFYVLEPGAWQPAGRGRILHMPAERDKFAAALYAEMHKADTEGLDWVAVQAPPDTPEWAGIRDRLLRASRRGEAADIKPEAAQKLCGDH
jgi:L-threonylcarbamoyladenylate synthase